LKTLEYPNTYTYSATFLTTVGVISIPSSSKSIRPMASESLTDDTFLSVGSSDKDSGIGTTLQSDLEVNKKSLEQGFIQEEQEITTLGDGYFIFQLDE
jgi:hypothetical protein